MLLELKPVFENVKSYYSKATVKIEDNKKTLISYNTKVAEIEDGKIKVYNTQSKTTVRHIREFLRQNGFKNMSKKEIEQYYQ